MNVPHDFLTQQKQYPRVRQAITEKQMVVESKLSELGLKLDNYELLMVAYKDQDRLELHAKNIDEDQYQLLSNYEICDRSGVLGPKRKQGDLQVPEGFYHIDRFNPVSNYHLSLGINYPNASDRIKSSAANLGGDIFIHGNCTTIGCLPMTDELIKEIYLFATHAKDNGQQKIPVYIFPFEMDDSSFQSYHEDYRSQPQLVEFWRNLKLGYDQWIKDHQELDVDVNEGGVYVF